MPNDCFRQHGGTTTYGRPALTPTHARKLPSSRSVPPAPSRIGARHVVERGPAANGSFLIQRQAGDRADLILAQEQEQEQERGERAATSARANTIRARHTFSRVKVQPKLRVSAPDDPYEREADRMAERIARMPEPKNGCACGATCTKCQDDVSRREQRDEVLAKTVDGADTFPHGAPGDGSTEGKSVPDETSRRVEAIRKGGHPLPPADRRFMESRFGYRFDAVRIHTGAKAARVARELNARAFTVGSHIAFSAGEFRTDTAAGRALLAHELTHVVQQAPGSAQMIHCQEDEAAPPISRAEEIRRSRSSPGRAAAQASPPALSLFNYGIDRHRPKGFHTAIAREFARFVRNEIRIPTRIEVIGHASAPGRIAYNETLSLRRARAVAAILSGVGLANVGVRGSGESAPIASNDTVDGRSRNRRVDLHLTAAARATPVPQPPESEPPGPEPPQPPGRREPPRPEREDDLCERYPLLCRIVPPIPVIPIPPLLPFLCVVAPELCALGVCIINPALCIPGPPGPPPPPEPPERPPERPDEDQPGATFGRVRASNTPTSMRDRIPDQGSTSVPVRVSGLTPSMGAIRILSSGTGALNGDVRINGASSTTITGSTVLSVSGVSQTSPLSRT
jgi:outer membrane protein OmpA-like peptidoglycan-associated protein